MPDTLFNNLRRHRERCHVAIPATTACHQPDRRWLVFWERLPCAACSRILCFSSSRWPRVVSSGTAGALPGPLWLWLSSGTGGMVLSSGLVMRTSLALVCLAVFATNRTAADQLGR
jgi:hypothetical protein